jgi:hypothetical protein
VNGGIGEKPSSTTRVYGILSRPKLKTTVINITAKKPFAVINYA